MDTERFDVIIATVGKQPMPVLIPLLQFGPVSGQLIVTDEVKEVAHNLQAAVRLTSQAFQFPRPWPHDPVNPYDARETYDRCRQIATNPRHAGKHIAINITGGTTLMAMGAQQAARELEKPMLYVDTDDNVIVLLSPAGHEVDRRPIAVSLSADVYLAAHGASVTPKPAWGTGVPNEEPWTVPFRAAAGLLGRAGSHSQRLLDQIRLAYNQADRAAALDNAGDRERDLIDQLARLGLLTDVQEADDTITFRPADDKLKREFLGGHWLEVYVHDACRQSQMFDNVMLSATVKRPARPKTIENELDVIVTRRGRLAAVSCKTGLKETQEEDVDKEAVYELDSLLQAELMGLYARKLLVTNRNELPPALTSRAYRSQIRCVTGPQLPDVADIIKAHLEG